MGICYFFLCFEMKMVTFENILVWMVENDAKMLVWVKIFFSVFFKMNTETFENALVWMGPESGRMSLCFSTLNS